MVLSKSNVDCYNFTKMSSLQWIKNVSESNYSRSEGEAMSSEHGIPELLSRICTPEKRNINIENHAKNSMKIMETYFHNQQLTDVVLVAGSKRISAHRLVLGAASNYFSTMFTGPMKESTQEEIELIEVDGDALSDLVEFCYTGCIELQEGNVETLFKTAYLLQFNPIVEMCCQYLSEQLDPGNCLGIKLFAATQGCVDLSKTAHAFALKHFVEVMKNQEFLSLSVKEVVELLNSEDLTIPSEETVFHALIIWIQHDFQCRSNSASKLLGCVKLPLLSPGFIAEHIQGNELFKSQRMAQDLISEAFMFHLLPEHRSLSIQSGRARPRKAAEEMLLVLGQNRINAVYLEDDEWKDLKNWSIPMRFPQLVFVEDDFLIVSNGLDEFWKTESLSNSLWKRLPPMNTNRNRCDLAVLGGLVYAVGGEFYSNTTQIADTVERWDPASDKWSYCTDWTRWRYCKMSAQRSFLAVAVLNNKLYAVGGSNGITSLRSVECYNPQTSKWTSCAPMSERRACPKICVLNELLYVLGGSDGNTSLHSMERYDPKTDTWLTVAPLRLDRCIGFCAMGNRIIAIDQNPFPVQAYDPVLNKWQKVSPLMKGGFNFVVVKKSFLQT